MFWFVGALKEIGGEDVYWNRPLYSESTRSGEPRAHWNPGVGLWQLDRMDKVRRLNHAERADITNGGLEVAKKLRYFYCRYRKVSGLGTWVACNAKQGETKNRCVATYKEIYDEMNDSLFVKPTSGTDVDGGIVERECRWGTDGDPMTCYIYDVNDRAQGSMDRRALSGGSGTNPLTPLAAPFISFTDPADKIKYAVFPASYTGYTKTLIRVVKETVEARYSKLGSNRDGWYVGAVKGRSLYIKACVPSESGPPTCTWTRL